MQHAAGNLQAPLHSARVSLDRRGRAVGKLQQVEHLVDAPSPVLRRDAVHERVKLEVLAAGQLLIERWILKYEPDALPDCGRVVDDVDACHARDPGGRGKQRAQHRDRGRLAGTVRSEKSEDLARANLQVDARDRNEVAIFLDEALGLDHGVRHALTS